VAKRRFQKGCFRVEQGVAYSYFYEDAADGSTRKVRHRIGCVPAELSERSARREHARIMHTVNQNRGSVAPAIRGKSFGDAVAAWRSAIAPNLSPATVRQRESYLRQHILPRFKDSALHTIDVAAIQQFATDMRKVLSPKTVINVLGTIFAITRYAEKSGCTTCKVSFADLILGEGRQPEPATLSREQAGRVVEVVPARYKALFATAWSTGLRAGELLALTVSDLDFDKKTIHVNKSADDRTREVRQPKTKNSVALLPMPSALAPMLREFLEKHYRPNPAGILFTNRAGTRSMKRESLVQYVLKPALRKLGISDKRIGLHSFRHGLATELANASIPLPALQQQMRHADVRTTLRVYAHVIPESQRQAVELAAISTNVPISTAVGA
jgi:integrase